MVSNQDSYSPLRRQRAAAFAIYPWRMLIRSRGGGPPVFPGCQRAVSLTSAIPSLSGLPHHLLHRQVSPVSTPRPVTHAGRTRTLLGSPSANTGVHTTPRGGWFRQTKSPSPTTSRRVTFPCLRLCRRCRYTNQGMFACPIERGWSHRMCVIPPRRTLGKSGRRPLPACATGESGPSPRGMFQAMFKCGALRGSSPSEATQSSNHCPRIM